MPTKHFEIENAIALPRFSRVSGKAANEKDPVSSDDEPSSIHHDSAAERSHSHHETSDHESNELPAEAETNEDSTVSHANEGIAVHF